MKILAFVKSFLLKKKRKYTEIIKTSESGNRKCTIIFNTHYIYFQKQVLLK